MVGQRFELVDEAIENERPESAESIKSHGLAQPITGIVSLLKHPDVDFFYRYQRGHPVLKVPAGSLVAPPGLLAPLGAWVERSLHREELAPDQSIISQRKEPDLYPEITYLGTQYARIKLYREWNLGRYTPPRLPQQTDLPEDFLLPDASNLGLVLNDMEHQAGTKNLLLEKLRLFNDAISDYYTKIRGGTVQIFIHEKGLNQPIPATRLSDGTLRYLCLLTLLCHHSPPPVLCIEEPELGLHPDILPTIAELLIEASHRCQLFVTTHSDILVDSLSKVPEAVIVCEKHEGGTAPRRLNADNLSEWLEKYALGTLWRRGELGGNRW